MSALNSFAKEISKKGLTNFELADRRFTIKKVKDYLFVANSSRKHKIKKVNGEMDNLAQKFFKIYDNKILEQFDGDVSYLSECEECFREEIKESLEEPVKKFWEGIVNR